MKKTNIIKHKVYIDIGSHDKIFMFCIGEIAQKYFVEIGRAHV